ncbi:type II toxin-antitoxin system VapC family toxin [Acutalibacter muris]|uniref:type II toxin-antitoxin system VapC family toxin n=1 Tax=Acutalibacter muris TaxID=1796620 RepID=UPI00272CA97D|nr:PIN domain-containing protein [Acutalibacter muris]
MNDKREIYLLDTNAYFNFMRYSTHALGDGDSFDVAVSQIKAADCCISQISLIEIISVLGKYARGKSAGKEKCNCIIDDAGTICPHYKVIQGRKRWSNKRKKAWIKYFDEIKSGTSSLLKVRILPLDNEVWREAEKIIPLSMEYKFASLDALIAATARTEQSKSGTRSFTVVTSDKSLKCALSKCSIPIWDAFQVTH